MPFLRDEGPPIPLATIQKLRESLAVEYGWQTVNETGREVLVVRVPKAKPDYLHDLAEVAFYVGLENIRSTKDVLLIGHEKTARLEPQLLRDHIRAQAREDGGVVEHLRRGLDRQYGHTFVQSPSNHQHSAFAVRIPKETVAQFTAEDVQAIRHLVATLRPRVMTCQYAYVVANADHERLGRRVLLELIGEMPPAQAASVAPAAEPAGAFAAPPSPFAALADAAPARTPFPSATAAAPATPFATAAPAAAAAPVAPPAPAAPSASPASPAPAAWAASAAPVAPPAPVAPTASPPPVAPPAPPALAPVVEEHEEYEIVSRPKAPKPQAPPAPAPEVGLDGATTVHDEYEIVAKPKAQAAPEPAPEPTAAAVPAAAAPAADEPAAEKTMLREEKEYEVFVSKPRPRPDTPAITPPGQGGFQAALSSSGPVPAKTKEYEIMGRTSVTSEPTFAAGLPLPTSQPAHAPTFAPSPPQYEPTGGAIPPRVASTSLPVGDSGASIVARVAPSSPERVLAQRFREAGYEVVEGLRAQGTVFVFAAHRPNGRRVLVKRAEAFGAEDAASLAQLVTALGADVALVVADQVRPGTRIATWGTRIEVVTPADVPTLSF